MKWYEAKSPEDLKTLGTLRQVKIEINKDIKKITNIKDLSTFIKMGSNSWKGQYKKIQDLIKIGTDISFNIKIDNEFFLSEAHKNIFYLLELQGKDRMDKLKIYKSHYIDKEVAKEWYRGIAKSIHPDKCSNDKAKDAMAELVKIYNEMINDD